MNFTGGNRQRSGPVKHLHRGWEIVVRAQISVELRAVRLFDNKDAPNSFEGGG